MNIPGQIGIYSSTVSYLLIALALFLLLAVGYSLSKKHNKIKKNEPLNEKISHMTGDFARAGNTPEFSVKAEDKIIDPEVGQGFHLSIEETASVTEPESRSLLTKPVVESESKLSATGQVMELESGVSEQKASAENKGENKEKYLIQEAELAESGSEEENNNNSSEEPADNSEIEISASKKEAPSPSRLAGSYGHNSRSGRSDYSERSPEQAEIFRRESQPYACRP